jgi:hypothetical protein
MVASAPRIHPTLRFAIERLDRQGRPIAETHRLVGQAADLIGRPRPSYQRTRELVHLHRERRLQPTFGDVLVTVAFSQHVRRDLTRLFER